MSTLETIYGNMDNEQKVKYLEEIRIALIEKLEDSTCLLESLRGQTDESWDAIKEQILENKMELRQSQL